MKRGTAGMFNNELPVSYYEEISQLNKEHGVSIVRHRETGGIYVKKVLSVYNPDVYAALFSHPVLHTPRIHALYEAEGRLTVIEEYISGDSLSDILEIRGALTEQETVALAQQLCVILSDLHAFQPPIIHRDIKPSNIIITEDGSAVLLDMNASRFMDPEKARDTRLLGTPGYAAPEQYGFGSSTVPTDIYAVGALMDALLADHAADCSPDLRRVIDKCRELEPSKRYQSASELSLALSSVAQKQKDFSHRSGGNAGLLSGLRLKNCPVCGRRLPFEAKTCPDCGQAFHVSKAAAPGPVSFSSQPPPIPVREKISRHILPALNTLIALVMAILLLSHALKKPETSAEATTAAETTVAAETTAPPETTTAAETTAPPETTTAAETTAPAEPVPEDLYGSYEGETGSGITIYPDGTAVYYHEIETYSEPCDPWTYADGKITIELAKMSCTVTAEVTGNDFSELVFRSDSENWDDERFVKLPEENMLYYESAMRSYDDAITVLPDGQMEISFDGLTFTIPKHYLSFQNEFNSDRDIVILSAIDIDRVYVAGLTFKYEDFDSLSILDTGLTFPGYAKNWLYNFYLNVKLSDIKEETIAGTRVFTSRFTGETNQGYQGVTGIESEGYVAFFCFDDKGKVLRVVLSQSSESSIDNIDELEQILYGAQRK